VKKFLNVLKDKQSILFVIDEMGIGSNPLRNYGYSYIGTPAVLKRKKNLLKNNLTLTATISLNGPELMQFISERGTKNETFEWYFGYLVSKMKIKYPKRKLVFLLDNLRFS